MPEGIGTFYPSGLVFPNAWDNTDFTSATDLSGIPDQTAAIQTAINGASASGRGGDVPLPPGVTRVDGPLNIDAGGIRLLGYGWEQYSTVGGAGRRGRRGSYILSANPANSTIVVGTNANGCVIRDIGFIQPQPPEAGGWTPTAFQPTIMMTGATGGGTAGTLTVENVLFGGVYTGIQLGSLGHPVQRVSIRNVYGVAFAYGIDAQYCSAPINIDHVRWVQDPFVGSPNILSYVQTTIGGAINLRACVSPEILNLIAENVAIGIGMTSTADGAPDRARIVAPYFDNCGSGIGDGSGTGITASATMMITQMRAKGARGLGGSTAAFRGGGPTGVIFIDSAMLTNFAGNAIQLLQTADLRLGPNIWIDNWNADGLGGNNVYGINAPAGANVYGSGNTRFTNANGGTNTGGGGTFH